MNVLNMCNISQGVAPLLLLLILSVSCNKNPIRQTNNGPVEGILQTSSMGREYYAFRGIPYAEVPITGKDPYTGEYVDRRFKAPVELKREWNTRLEAHSFRDFCILSEYPKIPSTKKRSENCLFVNVYEPAGGSNNKTVLVWIHGGGFFMGDPDDSDFGPDFLLSEDNIFVTVQYRLGIFGFLNLGTEEYSGNMGLKDQQLALKWVHENIENFSGNKKEILILGGSAGAASVGLHLLNEQSRKYFNRAHLSSSSAFSYYALEKADHVQRMQDFVKINDKEKLIEYLKTADGDFLSTKYPFDWMKTLTFPFVPTIESPESIDAFITETPEQIYKSGKSPDKDVMLSFNSKEILGFRPNFIEKKEPVLTDDIEDGNVSLPFEGFNKSLYPSEYQQSLELLRAAYYPDSPTSPELVGRKDRSIGKNSRNMRNIIQGVIPLLLLLGLSVSCNRNPIRQTKNGPVEGVIETSSLGREYYAFRGIPFAEAPITGKDPNTGECVDRRFKAPVELKRKWNTSLEAHSFRDFCIPTEYPRIPSATKRSENCLFVNVYEPAGGNKNKTVLVWIHGGGFIMGDPDDKDFGPDFLLSEDNIVVKVQYRLGIFGFLNLFTEEYSGNMGLKDQQLALKWVHENIEHFSGNKHEILLFGESAGAASVGLQLLNEQSNKYFNRAYLSSSSAFSYYAISRDNHLRKMRDLVKINEKKKLIEYLKTADSEFLSTKYSFNSSKTLTFPFVPTIESPYSANAFITEEPEEIYKSGKLPNKDVMFSFNSKEILVVRPHFIGKKDPILKEDIEDGGVNLPFEGFNKIAYPNEYNRSLEILREAYYPDTNDTKAVERANINLLSDLMFNDSILKAVKLQATGAHGKKIKKSHKNTFLFRFSMNSNLNYVKFKGKIDYDGAAHGDDLCYYAHCHWMDEYHLYDEHLKRKDETYDMIMRMVKIITDFARTGNPSLENDTPFKSCESPNEIFVQEISDNSRSSVTTEIEEQLHYETWRKIEEIYLKVQKRRNIEFIEN